MTNAVPSSAGTTSDQLVCDSAVIQAEISIANRTMATIRGRISRQ